MRKPKQPICQWKGCKAASIEGSHFCAKHVQTPPSPKLPKWIRELPFAIGTGLAASVLYDMLKIFCEHTLFYDTTAQHVDRIMAMLRDPAQTDAAVEEAAKFVDVFKADPGWSAQMTQALSHSQSSIHVA